MINIILFVGVCAAIMAIYFSIKTLLMVDELIGRYIDDIEMQRIAKRRFVSTVARAVIGYVVSFVLMSHLLFKLTELLYRN